MGRKKSDATKNSPVSIDDSDEENGYLPHKYPPAGISTQEKLRNFQPCREDQKNASCSNHGQSKTTKMVKQEYKCGKCLLPIKGNQTTIECNKYCRKWFHFKCTDLEVKDLDFFMKELKKPNGKRWFCENCITNNTELSLEHIDWKRSINATSEIQKSQKVLDEKNKENGMEKLMSIVVDIQKSINFLSEKYDEIKSENKEMIILLKEIKKDRENLWNENSKLKTEMSNMKREIQHLKQKINSDEQTKLRNNIEIKGVAKQMHLKDEEITKKILNHIGVTIEEKNLSNVYRPNIPGKTNDIIKIQLPDYEIKTEILKKTKIYFKSMGRLTTKDIEVSGLQSTIYINEELTPRNKYLLGKGRELRKIGYEFVWWKNGKIFVKKNSKEDAIIINDEDDLKKLFEKK